MKTGLVFFFISLTLQASTPVEELIKAVAGNEVQKVSSILKKSQNAKELVNEKYSAKHVGRLKQATSLHIAAARADAEVVCLLLQAGANPDARTKNRKTPLWEAVWDDRESVMTVLLHAGADINSTYAKGRTPLRSAIARGKYGVRGVHLLLAYGADPLLTPSGGDLLSKKRVNTKMRSLVNAVFGITDDFKECSSEEQLTALANLVLRYNTTAIKSLYEKCQNQKSLAFLLQGSLMCLENRMNGAVARTALRVLNIKDSYDETLGSQEAEGKAVAWLYDRIKDSSRLLYFKRMILHKLLCAYTLSQPRQCSHVSSTGAYKKSRVLEEAFFLPNDMIGEVISYLHFSAKELNDIAQRMHEEGCASDLNL